MCNQDESEFSLKRSGTAPHGFTKLSFEVLQ